MLLEWGEVGGSIPDAGFQEQPLSQGSLGTDLWREFPQEELGRKSWKWAWMGRSQAKGSPS